MPDFLIPTFEQYRYLRLYKRRLRSAQDATTTLSRFENTKFAGCVDTTKVQQLQPGKSNKCNTNNPSLERRVVPPEYRKRRRIGEGSRRSVANCSESSNTGYSNASDGASSAKTNMATASQVSYLETNPDASMGSHAEATQQKSSEPFNQFASCTPRDEQQPSQSSTATEMPPPGMRSTSPGTAGCKYRGFEAETGETSTQSSASSLETEVAEARLEAMVEQHADKGQSQRDTTGNNSEEKRNDKVTESSNVEIDKDEQRSLAPQRPHGRLPSSILTFAGTGQEGPVSPIHQSQDPEMEKLQNPPQSAFLLKQQQIPFSNQSSLSGTVPSAITANAKPWFQKRRRKKLSQTRLSFSNYG